MKRYYLFQQRVGDFEVNERTFNSLLAFIDEKRKHNHHQLVVMTDDDEKDVSFYYVWSKSSDFTYIGYTEEV